MLVIFFAIAISPAANAFIELKGGYSLLQANPSEFNDYSAPREKVNSLTGLTGDILLNAAIMPINIGARYEQFTFDKGSGASQSKLDFQRISVVLNNRFIDTGAYVGLVATIGLSNELKDKITNNKASSSLSGSIGLEAGVKFGFLMVGVEGGYLIAPLGNLKTSTGGTVMNGSEPVTVDMSGVYGRGLVGFNF